MRTFSWIVTVICCCIAVLVLMIGLFGANGAPQEAAAGAVAAAIVIIPYVFSRAIEALGTQSVTATIQPERIVVVDAPTGV